MACVCMMHGHARQACSKAAAGAGIDAAAGQCELEAKHSSAFHDARMPRARTGFTDMPNMLAWLPHAGPGQRRR